jgi:hypothetical protein
VEEVVVEMEEEQDSGEVVEEQEQVHWKPRNSKYRRWRWRSRILWWSPPN